MSKINIFHKSYARLSTKHRGKSHRAFIALLAGILVLSSSQLAWAMNSDNTETSSGGLIDSSTDTSNLPTDANSAEVLSDNNINPEAETNNVEGDDASTPPSEDAISEEPANEATTLSDDAVALASSIGAPATLYSGVTGAVLRTTTTRQGQVNLSIGSEIIMGDSPFLDASNDANAAKYYYRTIIANISNAGAYTLSVQGANQNLISGEGHTIPAVTSATTLAEMPANHWGYSLSSETPSGNTVFSVIPTGAPSPFYSEGNGSGTINDTKQFYVAFAAKVNKQQPAGTYTNRVVVSAVAQPGQVATFSGITTMQQMQPSICKAANTNDTARLRDERDGRFYWVTKLADGNCWMSQNLHLNLSAGSALNSSTSDLNPTSTSSWTPAYSTTNTLSSYNSSQYQSQRSWTQGLYVLNTPTGAESCRDATLSASDCKTAGFVKVGNDWIYENGIATNRTTGGINNVRFVASSDPNFFVNNGGYAIAVEKDSSGRMRTDSSGNPLFKTNSSGYVEFDAHYLVGNWYQWNAAIAGGDGANNASTGILTNSATAPNSICPKNWKLPTSGADRDNTSGSFNYLLKAYGVNSSTVSSTSPVYDIAQKPLFFVRAGYIHSGGTFNTTGMNGFVWSSRASSTAQSANFLFFGESSVTPTSNNWRSFGNPVRCVARDTITIPIH